MTGKFCCPFLHALRWRLRHSRRPIVLGPWHSELGFEVLYWTPFLSWLLQDIPTERVFAITRGGAPVYPCPTYDLFTAMSPKDLRAHTYRAGVEQQSIKQYRRQAWEREVVSLARLHFGLSRPLQVHPSVMYRAFDGFWSGRHPTQRVLSHSLYPPLPKPPPVPGLPKAYSCVRFYDRVTYPVARDPALRHHAERVVSGLLQRGPVVDLSSSLRIDDHLDLPMAERDGVISLERLAGECPASRHLHVRLSALAHARSFVGVYGGMQQASLRYGVPSLGYYLTWQGTMPAHKHLSDLISLQTGIPFQVFSLRELGVFSSVWGAMSSAATRHAEARRATEE